MKRAIGLVSYPSSEEEDDGEISQPRQEPKKRKLPPLSSTLTLPKAIDNPALHQGRIRTTPHVEGQYASYVFIPLRIPRSSPLGKFIQEIYLKAKEIVPILHAVGTNDVSNEHEEEPELRISLTRPIYLRAQQREEFRVAMRAIAKRHDRFTASFSTFAELVNDERTRTFLTLEIGAGHLEMRGLCNALDPILRAYRQKSFYDNPRFHASIAWALLSPPDPDQLQDRGIKLGEVQNGSESGPEELSRVSTTKPAAHPEDFPTIPRLPTDLIRSLQRDYGPSLLSKHIGIFDVDEICVRIGKDVTRWKLKGH